MNSNTPKSNDPLALKYEVPPQHYFVWQKQQNIPIHETFYIENLAKAEVAPWELYGANACFVNLPDCFLVGAFILEIPPGKSLKRIHHMFEAQIYVVEGNGHTVIEQPGYPALTVSWQKGSLFSPPLNTHYQHFNRNRDRPARLLVVNNAPLVMSLFHSDRYIFSDNFVFDERFKGERDYFERPAKYLGSRLTDINYVRDLLKLDLYNWDMRGKGAKTTFLTLSDNTMAAHISSFEVGTYKKAHRHGAGAHVVMLDGEGYSLLWKDNEPRRRVEWRAGTMFVPAEWEWHQHFNTGATPARYLAIRNNNPVHPLRMGLPSIEGESDREDRSTQFGQSQIDFEYEDPVIYDDYARALKEKGIAIRQQRPTREG